MKNHKDNKVRNTPMTKEIYEQFILQMICNNIIVKINDNYSIIESDSDFDLESDSFDDIDMKQQNISKVFNTNSTDIHIQNNPDFSDITESDTEPDSA